MPLLRLPTGRQTLNARESRRQWDALITPLASVLQPLGYTVNGVAHGGVTFVHGDDAITLPLPVVRALAAALKPKKLLKNLKKAHDAAV